MLSAAAQLLLKKGADKSVPEIWLGVEGLRSGWVWLGIAAMVTSLFSWLYSLRFMPLNIAYNLAGLIQVLVPLASWLLLGEKIGPTRVCGILLVCAGVFHRGAAADAGGGEAMTPLAFLLVVISETLLGAPGRFSSSTRWAGRKENTAAQADRRRQR